MGLGRIPAGPPAAVEPRAGRAPVSSCGLRRGLGAAAAAVSRPARASRLTSWCVRLADVQADEAALDRDEEAAGRTAGIESLRAWWLRRMIQTRYPLREKMTLFWHSHFGVSNARVNNSPLMVRHVQTLRSHALGSYRALLDSVSQDPAVFLAFGADANRKASPNEQFSRQLMERLSLGPGHYGEEDVREAARAFTGWFVLQGRLQVPGTRIRCQRQAGLGPGRAVEDRGHRADRAGPAGRAAAGGPQSCSAGSSRKWRSPVTR